MFQYTFMNLIETKLVKPEQLVTFQEKKLYKETPFDSGNSILMLHF